MKQCMACGMPMQKPEDFAMGDTSKDYCRYCQNPDGSMQSYEQKLESFAGFLARTQGLDQKAAKTHAREMMSKLPAWKGR